MKRSISGIWLVMLALLTACGAARPPVSLEELRSLTVSKNAKQAREEAPGAWSEGIRYLAMAEEAVQSGDSQKAERFAGIGIIRVKVALASAEQAAARSRLESALESKRSVEDELERVRDALRRLEAEDERQRLRRHLEGVVDVTRRRAFAAEEIREGSLLGEEGEALSDARQELGREMMSRAGIWRHILEMLVSAKALDEKRTTMIKGELKLADEKLRGSDLVGLQQHLESAGVEARRLTVDVWRGKEEEREKAEARLAEQLASDGFDVVQEEFGPAVRFNVPVLKRGKPKKDWSRPLVGLGKTLAKEDKLRVVVLVSAGSASRLRKAKKVSLKRAQTAAKALVDGGMAKDRIRSVGCGPSAPLVALREGLETVAVLLVLHP
ncbi:MAG: hypothetical protein GY854_01580 [Deltaproteobacteria bacterium]|nr:hypothetical protein [Deltaproteobacteria bacterium]